MAYFFDIAQMGDGELHPQTNLPTIRASIPLTGDDDREEFGQLDSMQALGLSAMPAPGDADGAAECLVLRDAGNADGVIVGARDARSAAVYANLKPGSTVVHSTEAGAKAQVRCDPDGQVSTVVTDANGDTAAVLLDGKNKRFQIAAFGGWIEMSEDNGIVLTAPGGDCTLTLKDGTIMFTAKAVLLGGPASTKAVLIQATAGVPNTAGVFA